MRRLLLFACALFGFMACTQNPIEEQSAIRQEASETITVGFEGDDDTRIQLNSAQKTVWTKDDLVSVFYRSDANQKWQYQGESGERVGDLKRVENATSTTKTTKTVVVYPYSESYWLNTDSYAIDAILPVTQYYAKDSYGVGSNLMVSQSEFTQFSLKSVCGWLKLQLTGDGEVVKSIKFRGNNDEQVAGLIYVDTATAEATLASEMGSSDDNNAGGNLVFDDTILTEVTLDCGEGVTLGAEAIPFYISLPPQTFANGFTVEIEDTDGYAMEQSTAKTFVAERNTISPMAALEFVNPNRPTQPTPANNEIWYTATAKAEPYFDDFLTFGSDVVSNVWDSETKRGIITFNGDVTMIGDNAFNNCDKLTGITIPESVTSIGKNAFYECNGLTEFIIPDSVTTIGDSAFRGCSSLTSVTIGNSVTMIGNYAFRGCSSLQEFNGKFASEDGRCLIIDGVLNYFAPAGLTDYTIPDSVTEIGYGAFYYCNKLTSVTIPDSVITIGYYAFDSCSSLTSLTIPDSVTTIGQGAFYGCSSLTSVTIPDSVTEIGNEVFQYCYDLTSVTIPDSVTTIGEYAFFACSGLTSVTIGDSVTTIGEKAFYGCSSLKKVYCNATIPPSLGNLVFSDNATGRRIYVYEECVELYKSAWGYKDSIYTNGQNCPDTTTIEYTTTDGNTITSSKLPIISNSYDNGVGKMIISGIITEITSDVFRNCSNLTSVTIPDSVTTIGIYAFQGCSSLESITIPDSVTTIGKWAFSGCSSLTSITIPDSVTTIGDSAFYYCSSLTSVTIPDSVTTIEDSAFADCSSLQEFNGKFTSEDRRCLITDGTLNSFAPAGLIEYTIPDSVTTIGELAFYYCSSLISVTIPDSVTTIGEWAFRFCYSLTSVYCKATTPPVGGSDMFNANASGRKIYVPMESVEAYKSASYWSSYKSSIEGYNF